MQSENNENGDIRHVSIEKIMKTQLINVGEQHSKYRNTKFCFVTACTSVGNMRLCVRVRRLFILVQKAVDDRQGKGCRCTAVFF